MPLLHFYNFAHLLANPLFESPATNIYCRDGIMLESESDRSYQHRTDVTQGETEMSYYLNILVIDAQLPNVQLSVRRPAV